MHRLSLFALPLFFCVAHNVQGQVPPEKAEATFKVVDGLEFKLWASEPLFVNPTCMDIDHKGRVWVCESVNYRCTLLGKPLNRKDGDRIVILEDTKGEGKADKAITFYQSPDLLAPMGIAVAKDPNGPGYKVFVCQSPDILVFTDSKGEGKADGPPKKLLSGFQGIDHDHGVHGILIGPDMKLYFSVGDQGVKDLRSSDGKGRKWTSNNTDCRAGTIWRCDMDGTNLELIAHNFRNEYEPCVDSFGTIFTSDNDDDGNEQTRICYVMPGGNYGYHPRGPGQSHWHEEQPGVVPKILRTYFGSPTGMCVYEGTLLPKKYWGQLLHTDAGPRHVRCYHLEADGAGYKVDREDMVTSSDTWFRPSDICVAPDGSGLVADWTAPREGGPGMGDTTRGRIYRLAPKGNRPKLPNIKFETKEGLLTALSSPASSVRFMAGAKIRAMKFEDARDVVVAGMENRENSWLRARCNWQGAYLWGREINSEKGNYEATFPILRVQNKLMRSDVKPGSEEERFSLLFVRARHIAYWAADEIPKGWDFADAIKTLNQSPSAALRREFLVELREDEPRHARGLILKLAKEYDGKDRFYLAAVGIAVGQDANRREIILADFDKEFPEWNEKVAGLVWELRPPSMMPTLGKRLADGKIPAAQRAQIVDILATSDDKDAGKTLISALEAALPAEVHAKVVDSLKLYLPGKWRDLRASKELRDLVSRLVESERGRSEAFALIAAADMTDSVQCVHTYALDSKQPADVRRQALQTLGKLHTTGAVSALEAFLYLDDAKKAPELAVEAMRGLAEQVNQQQDKASAEAALKGLQTAMVSKDLSDELKREALSALAGTRQGSEWLLGIHAKKELPEKLVADAGRLLRNSPHQDLRNKAMIAFPPPGKLDPKKLPSPAALASRRGDAKHGQQILAASTTGNLQCLKCHTVRGVGGQIGPDLSMIGKKASRENLFESILLPSKAIADQYLTWNIETKKGVTVSGLIVEETPEFVTVRDANGKDTRIATKDIDDRKKSLVSIMPADLLVYMSEDELVDLVEYLFTLKTPVLGFDYWRIAGPFDNGENDAGLDKVFPPEKSIDLSATYNGKVGKVTWRTVKPAANGYFDLMAFHGKDSPNSVSYLYREVESPTEQEGVISLGTDDGSKLWVNGEMVYTTRAHNAAVPDAAAVKVKLKKGKNTLLLKINNGNDPHGFYLSVQSEQELKRVESK
jgi:putative membrane-bound dehydrogenase-like protein